MVRLGRDEALTLIGAWVEDRALLRVELHMRAFAATFLARAVGIGETGLSLIADNGWAELILPLTASLGFGFGDLREWPKEAAEFERLIVIFLDGQDLAADREFVSLADAREPISPDARIQRSTNS